MPAFSPLLHPQFLKCTLSKVSMEERSDDCKEILKNNIEAELPLSHHRLAERRLSYLYMPAVSPLLHPQFLRCTSSQASMNNRSDDCEEILKNIIEAERPHFYHCLAGKRLSYLHMPAVSPLPHPHF